MCHYDIFQNNEKINSITASESFVKGYCEKHGYTYSEIIEPEPEPVTPIPIPPSVPLYEKLQAVSDRQDFLEDCIAEMATQVYS